MKLAERGYALLPLAPRSKEPHMELLRKIYGSTKWSPLAENPATAGDVESWREFDPECNIGLITGKASGGLVIWDVDNPRKAPDNLFTEVQPRVRTARGFHLYAFSKLQLKTTRLPFGELKAEGSYVVIPPSVHPDGTIYTWEPFLLDVPIPPLPYHECLRTSLLPISQEESPRTYQDTCTKNMSLDRLLGSGDFIIKVAAFLGSPIVQPEQKFKCPLHPDESVSSANFHLTRDGTYLFRCWHVNKSLKLGDLYRYSRTGNLDKLPKGSSASWLLRLAVDSGYLAPPVVDAQDLPEDAPTSAREVFEGCKLLHQCHLLYKSGNNSFPATKGFLSEWCGLDPKDARSGRDWLIERGFLVVREKGQAWKQGVQHRSTLYRLRSNHKNGGGNG
jgi:hypothetical protein